MKLFISVCLLCVSGFSFAECPSTMSEEKLIECIMIEGSGANYQDWLSKFNNPDNTRDSVVSEITGEDIRKIKPASGSKSQ